MNMLSAENVLDAMRLVTKGAVFRLDAPVGYFDPAMFGRSAHRLHTLGGPESLGLDDVLDNYYPQASSQWDGIGHMSCEPDTYYNGVTSEEIIDGGALGIDHIASRGIVTRGVLLDLADVVAERGGPAEPVALTVEDLERARTTVGVEIRPGDVLHVHTGFVEWYGEQGTAERERLASLAALTSAGIAHGPEMAEYLWDLHIPAVVSDAPSCEVWPFDDRFDEEPFGFLHRTLLARFGMMIGELWQLADLAHDCRDDGVYEFLLVSSPLRIPHGVGSPANALAIK
jgi:kynurenine formamidase